MWKRCGISGCCRVSVNNERAMKCWREYEFNDIDRQRRSSRPRATTSAPSGRSTACASASSTCASGSRNKAQNLYTYVPLPVQKNPLLPITPLDKTRAQC